MPTRLPGARNYNGCLTARKHVLKKRPGFRRAKKKARSTWDRAFPVCSAGGRLGMPSKVIRLPAELRKQPRVPQESHLRKLLTAAHTYSQNWSRITSISREQRGSQRTSARGLAKPSRACFEGDCRSRLGKRDVTSRPGTPALVWPSTARRRAPSPGNASPGTNRTRNSTHERRGSSSSKSHGFELSDVLFDGGLDGKPFHA